MTSEMNSNDNIEDESLAIDDELLTMLFDGIEQEVWDNDEKEHGSEADAIVSKYSNNILMSPRSLKSLVMNPASGKLKTVLRRLYPDAHGSKLYDIAYIHENYHMYSAHLRDVIVDREGTTCSSDKSAWLIKSYINYCVYGTEIDMTITDNVFWKPSFGSSEDWVDFIKHIALLYHGHVDLYLAARSKIKEA